MHIIILEEHLLVVDLWVFLSFVLSAVFVDGEVVLFRDKVENAMSHKVLVRVDE